MDDSGTHIVNALRATKRGRISLHVDGEFVCTVGVSLVARHHLFAGKKIDDEQFAQLRQEALSDKVRADAYRLLGQRARSRHELGERLREKGYEAPFVDQTLDRLADDGLLDDSAFARAFVADKRRFGGWGDERIIRELSRFGVAAELARAALGPPDAEDQLQRAADALRKRGTPSGDRNADMRRALAFLQRRGFSTPTSYSAVRTWVEGTRND